MLKSEPCLTINSVIGTAVEAQRTLRMTDSDRQELAQRKNQAGS